MQILKIISQATLTAFAVYSMLVAWVLIGVMTGGIDANSSDMLSNSIRYIYAILS